MSSQSPIFTYIINNKLHNPKMKMNVNKSLITSLQVQARFYLWITF